MIEKDVIEVNIRIVSITSQYEMLRFIGVFFFGIQPLSMTDPREGIMGDANRIIIQSVLTLNLPRNSAAVPIVLF